MRYTLLTLTVFFIWCNAMLAGGPWTQRAGKSYIKLSEWWTVFDQHFTDTGQLDPNVTTGIYNTFLYAELGLSDRLTTIFNGVVFSRNYMNNVRSVTTSDIIIPGDAINTIGDIDISLKYALTAPASRIPVSLSLVLGIPTGATSGGAQDNLQTGDGEFNQMIQLDVGTGYSLGTLPGYVSGFVGFNHRTNGFSEEIRLGLESGVNLLSRRLWLITRLMVLESLKNGVASADLTNTSIFANNTEFASFGLEANYYITDTFGLSAGAAGAFRGEVIAASPSYTIGVFLDLTK